MQVRTYTCYYIINKNNTQSILQVPSVILRITSEPFKVTYELLGFVLSRKSLSFIFSPSHVSEISREKKSSTQQKVWNCPVNTLKFRAIGKGELVWIQKKTLKPAINQHLTWSSQTCFASSGLFVFSFVCLIFLNF